ncbi:ATP-dependent DNA helicase chl1 [Hondaea fermentalgiana]|uniref:DNA 5'-3' helicase n=1 Tax=Hondaea fermentalgiana TaxID=2315210 RepID=A0A2R5G9Z7_9STRA|nr:ATP-dependent DNA helicase chl1 [Hondaea fermentalgiana]|eukprot:GBG27852.1 ATP-dependent DNA helicase chl1 [Hondaea fermentalgiana]
MSRPEEEKARWAWPFAFAPYDIQKQFMSELYETLEHGDVGIFESPTGSGKSLSMIASALHWLKVNRHRVFLDDDGDAAQAVQKAAEEPAWIPARINEKCLDLIDQARKEKDSASPAPLTVAVRGLPARSSCTCFDKNAISRLSDDILYEAQDIESVAEMAKEDRTCGYYAARAAVREAEFVALPYSMLLHRKTRESLGIELKGNVIICDEAHNVIEAINEVHSVSLSLADVTQARADLVAYRDRYRTRLNPVNKVSINNLLVVVAGLQTFMQRKSTGKESSLVVTCGALAIEADIDHVNIFSVLRFLELSRLPQKLRGFADRYLEHKDKVGQVAIAAAPPPAPRKVQSLSSPRPSNKHAKRVKATQPSTLPSRRKPASLRPVHAFLEGLSNAEKDGKVLVVADGPRTSMKFLMLNPGTHFREIVDQAHAVVLAGGTMKPTVDVETQLFGHLPSSKIRLFSCGHVIPKENMVCLCLGSGPTRTPLELTFANRGMTSVMDEIARSLVNMCSLVPNGLVVFLPSYAYADQLFARWKESNQWTRLEAKKTIVCDTRDAVQSDKLLETYAAAARSPRGALLFSVVGGKLSEGINFKDELARCVVMVGLPFPNARDPELKAKMDFLDRPAHASKDAKPLQKPALSSKDFYENICMKAVNQCIGRAIRHRDDFAAVVLMDARYARPNIAAKLPKWIVGDNELALAPSFGRFVQRLRAFLANKRDAI